MKEVGGKLNGLMLYFVAIFMGEYLLNIYLIPDMNLLVSMDILRPR